MTEISILDVIGVPAMYEYASDWRKVGEELRCEDWKPEVMSNGSRTEEH